jgi:hypothetical protein
LRFFFYRLFVFAIHFDASQLYNAVMDVFIARLYIDNAVRYDILSHVNPYACESPLWALVIGDVEHCGGKRAFVKWTSAISQETMIKIRAGETWGVKGVFGGGVRRCGYELPNTSRGRRVKDGMDFSDAPLK